MTGTKLEAGEAEPPPRKSPTRPQRQAQVQYSNPPQEVPEPQAPELPPDSGPANTAGPYSSTTQTAAMTATISSEVRAGLHPRRPAPSGSRVKGVGGGWRGPQPAGRGHGPPPESAAALDAAGTAQALASEGAGQGASRRPAPPEPPGGEGGESRGAAPLWAGRQAKRARGAAP